MAASRLILIGMGGHSKVIRDIALRCGHEIIGHLDDHHPQALGPISSASEHRDANTAFVIAIGSNAVRRRLADRLRAEGVRFATLIDPSAILGSGVTLGEGTVVMPGVIVNADAQVGAHVILNTAATVDHDCVIGDFAHLSPGVHLAGTVQVGAEAHIGTGASVIPGISVGAGAVVGAGAAVVRDLPPGVTAVGVPARVLNSKGELET